MTRQEAIYFDRILYYDAAQAIAQERAARERAEAKAQEWHEAAQREWERAREAERRASGAEKHLSLVTKAMRRQP
jgi:hypothetical protein